MTTKDQRTLNFKPIRFRLAGGPLRAKQHQGKCEDFFCTLMVSNWWRKGYNKYKGVCPVITIITVLGKGEPYDSVFIPFPVYVECTFRFCSFP